MYFFENSVQYLGHTIDSKGLHKADDKIEAITNSPRPNNISELRQFIRLVDYYNKFIPDLATMIHPLNRLIQKDQQF